LRFENDKGTFDVRDYRKDNPLGFENLVNKWIEQKERSKVKPRPSKTNKAFERYMQPRRQESTLVVSTIKELQKKKAGKIVKMRNKKNVVR
jgi:hypothetical protein